MEEPFMECGINRGEVSSGNASSADMVQMYLNTNARSTASVVSVPSELFKVSETYTIALTATNYLNISGKGSVSVTIANGSVPQIRLYANTPIVYRSQELMFTAIARLSPCCKLFNQTAEYSWRVYDGYRLSNALSSSSLDPRVFRLAAYSLDPGWNYTFRATVVFNSPSSTGISASSSFRVIVGVKGIFATIRGGYSQTFDISQSIVLDATGSYDIDDPTNKTLTFRWSCSVFSPNLGAQCTGFVAGSGNIQSISATQLGEGTYNVSVTVTNRAGNSGSAATLLVVISKPVPFLSFGDFQQKYNPRGQITLAARLTTVNYTAIASWTSLTVPNFASSSIALTPLSRSLSPGSSIYQLALNADLLTSGKTYAFQLQAIYVGSKVSATSLISVTMNYVPQGGSLLLSPSQGTALDTLFYLETSLWVDFDEDCPLLYSFTYFVQVESQQVMLKASSPVPYSSAYLAQGVQSLDYAVSCVVIAADTFGGQANFTSSVRVFPSVVSSTVAFASSNAIQQAIVAKDAATVSQLVFAAAATLSSVTCSAAPICDTLNRYQCERTENTCGACKEDFIGVEGDANTPCLLPGGFSGIGDSCTSNSSCITGFCQSGACSDRVKPCPANCNAHGQCRYFINNINEVERCFVTDTECQASCTGDDGYYGKDCSLSQQAFDIRASWISDLCSGLLSRNNFQDMSEVLLVSLASSVQAIFSDAFLVNEAAYLACAEAMLVPIELYPDYACSASVFEAIIDALSAIAAIDGKLTGLNISSSSVVIGKIMQGIVDLSTSCQTKLALGQAALSTKAANIRISTLQSSDINVLASVAQSTFEQASGDTSASVSIDTSSVGAVNSVGITLLQLTNNPLSLPSNSSVATVQLQLQLSSSEADARRRLLLPSNANVSTIMSEITLVNAESLSYKNVSPAAIELACSVRSEKSYWVNATCADGRKVSALCPANTKGLHNITCPGYETLPVCLSWNGSALTESSACRVKSFDAQKTVCQCTTPITVSNVFTTRRQLQTSSSLYQQYGSRQMIVRTTLSQSFVPFEEVASKDTASVLASLSVILGLCAVLIGSGKLFEMTYPKNIQNLSNTYVNEGRHEQKNGKKSKVIRALLLSTIPPLLLEQYSTWQLLWRRKLCEEHSMIVLVMTYWRLFSGQELQYQQQVQQRHTANNLFNNNYNSNSSRSQTTSHWSSAVKVSGQLLSTLCLTTIYAYIFFPDDGECARLSKNTANEQKCVDAQSFMGLFKKCRWVTSEETCLYKAPDFSVGFVLLSVSLVVIIAISCNRWLRYLLQVVCISAQQNRNVKVVSPAANGDAVEDSQSFEDNAFATGNSSSRELCKVRSTNESIDTEAGKELWRLSMSDSDCAERAGNAARSSVSLLVGKEVDEFKFLLRSTKAKLWKAARLMKMLQVADLVPAREEASLLLTTIADVERVRSFCKVVGFDKNYDVKLAKNFYDILIRDRNEVALIKCIESSRREALLLSRQLNYHSSDANKERYLLSEFFIAIAHPTHQHLLRILLSKNSLLEPFNNLRKFRYLHAVIFAFSGFIVLYFGVFAYLSIRCSGAVVLSNAPLWGLILSLSIIQLFGMVEPLLVLLRSVIVTRLLLEEHFMKTVRHFADFGRVIYRRQFGSLHNHLAVIQHVNPVCRAARSNPSLLISRWLWSINDVDVHLANPIEFNGWEYIGQWLVLLSAVSSKLHFGDLILELTAYIMVQALVLCLYSIGTVSVTAGWVVASAAMVLIECNELFPLLLFYCARRDRPISPNPKKGEIRVFDDIDEGSAVRKKRSNQQVYEDIPVDTLADNGSCSIGLGERKMNEEDDSLHGSVSFASSLSKPSHGLRVALIPTEPIYSFDSTHSSLHEWSMEETNIPKRSRPSFSFSHTNSVTKSEAYAKESAETRQHDYLGKPASSKKFMSYRRLKKIVTKQKLEDFDHKHGPGNCYTKELSKEQVNRTTTMWFSLKMGFSSPQIFLATIVNMF